MTTTAEAGHTRSAPLARLSPLVLLAVAMPWLLEEAIVRAVTTLAPAHSSLVTEGIVDAALYPVITGSITLVGLYALLDPATRRSVFPSRRPTRRELLLIPVAGVATYLIGALAAVIPWAVFGPPTGGAATAEGIDATWIAVYAVTGLVFAPLTEEVLFRGLLLGYLLERDVSVWVAGGVVAVAFGLIHYYAGPTMMVAATVMGVFFVALRLRYDNLLVPIGAHAGSNAMTGLMIVVLSQGG